MLGRSHARRALRQPKARLVPAEADARRLLAALRPPFNRVEASAPDASGAGSGFGRLEAFAARYLATRDELAWRAARGEPLTAIERAALLAYDEVLDELLPGPPPVPEDVRAIMDDVLREHRR